VCVCVCVCVLARAREWQYTQTASHDARRIFCYVDWRLIAIVTPLSRSLHYSLKGTDSTPTRANKCQLAKTNHTLTNSNYTTKFGMQFWVKGTDNFENTLPTNNIHIWNQLPPPFVEDFKFSKKNIWEWDLIQTAATWVKIRVFWSIAQSSLVNSQRRLLGPWRRSHYFPSKRQELLIQRQTVSSESSITPLRKSEVSHYTDYNTAALCKK
jgi:hypothetical protein